MNVPSSIYPVMVDEYDLNQISAFSRDFTEMLTCLIHKDICSYVNDKRLRRAMEYIEMNYHESIVQSEVAESVGLTPSQLARLLREQTYMTFTEIVNELRVAHAVRLICETNDSLELIAFDCGFGTGRTFTREFRQFTGFTPADFRDSCKKLMQRGYFVMPQLSGCDREQTHHKQYNVRGRYSNAGNDLCHFRSMAIAY